jgi:perosamine synthetase
LVRLCKPVISDEEKKAVIKVLDSGMLASGEQVSEFERRFAEYVGMKHGIATSSGTTALHAAMAAIGIGSGDKVITTPFTFIASANSILYCGADPVFVDIDPRTFNIDPEKLEYALKKKEDVKAILVVHLFGLPCDMQRIMEIAEKYSVKVVEDCAQAHGAAINGKKVGTFGHVAAFSFYPTKNMTTGEGGAIVTDDEGIMERCRKLVNHGRTGRYLHDTLGYNYRMTNIAAAIGLAQLGKLDEFNKRRIANAKYMSENLVDLDWLEVPFVPEGFTHVFHQYTIKAEASKRDFVAENLRAQDIDCAIIYPVVVCKQPLYEGLGYADSRCSLAEGICDRVLSLPVHPTLEESELGMIVKTMTRIW